MKADLLAPMLLGVLSTAHCVGMCGGFAVAVAGGARNQGQAVRRQLTYSLGRITTYAFLGAVAGFAGLRLAEATDSLLTVQRTLSIAAGAAMILVAAAALGLFRTRFLAALGIERALAPAFSCMLQPRRSYGYFLAGIFNGFLPCGVLYALLATAVATGSVSRGATVMFAFGLGTIPAMVAIGSSTRLLAHPLRHRVFQLAACSLAVMGAVTVARAIPGDDGQTCCHATHSTNTSTGAATGQPAQP